MADVTTRHPDMTVERAAEWQLMAAAESGESAVKLAGETYLPMPSGFKALPNAGRDAYAAYRGRAQFPEILAPSLAAMIGIVHGKAIAIETHAPLIPESFISRTEPNGVALTRVVPDAYALDSAARAPNVRTRILQIHGDADEVIPYALGEALHRRLPEGARFVRIAGGTHNLFDEASEREIDAFVREVVP